MKIAKKIALTLLVVFVLMQFYRPEKNIAQGDHTANFLVDTNPPRKIMVLLEQTCYDCHSDNTVYPWYNNVAPISYWLADHIKHGKSDLNFSAWETYSLAKKDHKLEEVIEMVEKEEMPLKEYTWTHKEAKLTQEERNALMEWARNTRALYQLNLRPD